MSLDFILEHITLDTGPRFADVIDDWQRDIYGNIFSDRFRHFFVELPRGHDKTGCAENLIIVGLYLGRPGWRGFGIAVDRDQARLLLEGAIGKIKRNERLRPMAKFTNSEIIIEETNSVFRVLAADAPSSYGLRGDFFVVDEIEEFRKRELWDSVWTATGKRRASMCVIGTAGWNKASIAAEVRGIAESEDDWYFCSLGQVASWIDPRWLEQQKRSLPPHVYERLHGNRWIDGEGAFLSALEIESIFENVPEQRGGPFHLGLDLGLTDDRCVAAILSRTEGLAVVHQLIHWKPKLLRRRVDLMEVEADVEDVCKRYNCGVTIDPWQAVGMSQRLSARGVAVREHQFSSEGRRRLYAKLLDDIRTNKLRSIYHDEFRRELLEVEIADHGGGLWKVTHRSGGHDDYTTAVALALIDLAPDMIGDTTPTAHGFREAALSSGREWEALPTPGDRPTGVWGSGQRSSSGIDWTGRLW